MQYVLHHTTWSKNKIELARVRRLVFVDEQHVPEELEWDEYDTVCHHILVTDNHNNPVATGRIKPDGHIGRMAVLKSWRNKGVGSKVLNALLEYAIKNNMKSVYLHAQVSAIPFYEKHGFITNSEEFMDAGIPHKTMRKDLQLFD